MSTHLIFDEFNFPYSYKPESHVTSSNHKVSLPSMSKMIFVQSRPILFPTSSTRSDQSLSPTSLSIQTLTINSNASTIPPHFSFIHPRDNDIFCSKYIPPIHIIDAPQPYDTNTSPNPITTHTYTSKGSPIMIMTSLHF